MKAILVSLFRPALLALGCALVVAAVPAAQAADAKAPALPLKASFEKSAPGENGGPYSVHLVNTSAKALKVTAQVYYSVVSHQSAKTKTMPAQVVEAGKTLTIADLAIADKVTLTADGFEPLVVEVPPAKK
jgi:hypothetical protein